MVLQVWNFYLGPYRKKITGTPNMEKYIFKEKKSLTRDMMTDDLVWGQ